MLSHIHSKDLENVHMSFSIRGLSLEITDLSIMSFCSGQRCTAVKVICVMESVAEELVTKIVEKMTKLKVGMPEDNCDITPVVSASSANFIQGLVEDAQAKGAKFHQVCPHTSLRKLVIIESLFRFHQKLVEVQYAICSQQTCSCAGVEERRQLDLACSH